MRPGILFVEQHAFLGGGQRIIVSLATHPKLAENWRVRFALPEAGPLSEVLEQAQIPVDLFPTTKMRDGPKTAEDLLGFMRDFGRQTQWFRRLIKAQDISYVYTTSPRYAWQLLQAVSGTACRVVFHLAHFYTHPAYELYLTMLFAHPKTWRVICPSKSSEKWGRERLYAARKTFYAPNWICTEIPALKVLAATNESPQLPIDFPAAFRFAVIGRLVHIKGQDLFLEAAQLLSDKQVDAEYYVIGGDAFADRSDYGAELMRLYGANSRVHFVGHLEDMRSVYTQLNCVVVPSRYEVFGLTAAEAMYYGVPVIVSDFGELPEIVQGGEGGAIFRAGSATELARAMQRMVEDHNYRESIIRNGKVWVRVQYVPEIAIPNVINLLQGGISDDPHK